MLLSIEDLESREETLEVLSDAKLIDDIRKGDRYVKAGRIERFTREELLARRAGR